MYYNCSIDDDYDIIADLCIEQNTDDLKFVSAFSPSMSLL